MHISTLYNAFKKSTGVSTDSRSIAAGNMFFALNGPSFDGNIYAQKALDRGAKYAVIDNETIVKDKRYLFVPDVLTALQELASNHRKQLDIPFICITGSNGKTTTKELAHAILSQKFNVFATKGNLNNHIGVPLSVLAVNTDHEMAIIELGANHVGEIAALCEIAQPNFGIITNIGIAHIEGFGSKENIFKAKTELFEYIKHHKGKGLFIHANDTPLMKAAEGIRTITFGPKETFIYGKVKKGTKFCELELGNEEDRVTISSQLIGDYNINNIMAAAAIGRFFGISFMQTKTAIEAYTPKNNRSQYVEKEGNAFIMDAYNANPSSMEAAINNFLAIDYPIEKKGLILGHMLELGAHSFQEHAKLLNANKQFVKAMVGKEFEPFKDDFQWFETIEEMKSWFSQQNFKDYLFLVKGSRGGQLEKLLQ